MEHDFRSFRRDLQRLHHQKLEGGKVLDYDDAFELVKEEITPLISETLGEKDDDLETKKKDKKYLREKKKAYRDLVSDVAYSKDIHVRGYEKNKINVFIDEMVEEICGYSVLAKAFEDPSVSDIYCITWKKIFIEKNGVNQRYVDEEGNPITFRSPKHYKDTIERFLREAGEEINVGENKIVDFELYGDRGCATSPAVSPNDYTLTIRKHAESHITRDQLLEQNVLSKEMADFIGMLILGETNIICAGITGSGKTTTIRALIDYYVTRANKRMLVCEDTQELFPQNEHTVEFVSVKHDDKRLAVSLTQLIYTALRLKPKYIVVGEVRGEEAMAASEGMETGHSTIFTMHGGTPWNIMNRLANKYLQAMPSLTVDVVERILGTAVDYIFIQDHIPNIGRKITSISEISYDFEERTIVIKPICRYDFRIKDFIWEGKISQEKADKMLRRGIPYEYLEKWLETQEA